MAKVGRFVTDPRAGAYCQVTLDTGEKIVVNHEKGDFKGGRLTIEVSKSWASAPTSSSRATWTAHRGSRSSPG